ncbi:MAG TPA: glycosyltransferase [Candidatus Brocadiia bacterium]|nr:glycosyltransferase [Candidatus Brocadiia bacterium]
MGHPLVCIVGEFPSHSETFVEQELRFLAKEGLDPLVLALSPSRLPDSDPRTRGLPPVRVCPMAFNKEIASDVLHWFGADPVRFILVLMRIIQMEWEHPRDVSWAFRSLPGILSLARRLEPGTTRLFYAHFAGVPTTLAAALSDLTGVPFAFSCHARDIYAGSSLPLKAQRASLIITCTQANRIHLTSICGVETEAKSRVIYHGTDPGIFKPAERKGRPEEPPLILTGGRLVPKKGFDTLIRACAKLRDTGRPFRCCILGEGEERRRLEGLTSELSLGQKVTFVGMVPHGSMEDYLNRADIVVAPSIIAADGDRDGIPNILVEAMACGKPVVASRLSGIPELVSDGETGLLVPPGDPGALFDALVRPLDDPVMGARMGKAGRAKVLREFNAERNCALVARALRGLMKDVSDVKDQESGTLASDPRSPGSMARG